MSVEDDALTIETLRLEVETLAKPSFDFTKKITMMSWMHYPPEYAVLST